MARHFSKIILLAGACLALAAPANAEINWSGYGQLSGGGAVDSNTSYVDTLNSQWVAAGGAHVNMAFDTGLNLQFDVEGTRDFFSTTFPTGLLPNGLDFEKMTKYGVGLHLDWATDDYRLGALVSIGDSDWTHRYGSRLVTGGLEGAWFIDRTTLFSQLAYSRSINNRGGNPLDSWYLYVGGRYFLYDNLMFEADTGAELIEATPVRSTSTLTTTIGPITITDIAGDSNGNALHWSTKAEYLFQDLPVSLAFDYQGSYGTWRHMNYEKVQFPNGGVCGGGDINRSLQIWRRAENLFMLRLRYYFGQDSLIASDRNGATMSDYNPWYGAEPVTEAFVGDMNYVMPIPAC